MRRWCWWAPMPWEMDGGAVVTYYQLQKMNMLSPRDEHWAVPKVYEELSPQSLPWVNIPIHAETDHIPELMHKVDTPLLNMFHIGHAEFEKIIDPVHDIGGKILLWQTIHWPDDTILQSNRLEDIDVIVTPTEFAKRVFNVVRRIPLEKMVTIPHGVDLQKFYKRPTILRQKLGIKSHQKVILYSGRLSLWKGVHAIPSLIRPIVKDYDSVFIIRGGSFAGNPEGMALHQLFQKIASNNPNVIFIPEWQPPEFMEELYSMIDILLFNSGHEGFGVPLIEAQAVKAIPITTAINNHVEILGMNGDAGLLVEPKQKIGVVNDGTPIRVATSEQLIGPLRWLHDNPDEMRIMGERGRRNVEERFDLTNIAAQWLQLYDTLVPEGYDMNTAMTERILL